MTETVSKKHALDQVVRALADGLLERQLGFVQGIRQH